MRITLLLLLAVFAGNRLPAQQDSTNKIFAFKITGYINTINDSASIVQVLKPAALPVSIPEKQTGVLMHCYTSGKKLDTATIGWGKCQLIKSDYYYFTLKLFKGQQPAEGDLLYITTKLPLRYDGLLFNIMKHAAGFTDVYGKDFVSAEAVFTNNKQDELNLLDSMVSDIRYTGSAMQQQMPQQDQLINDGRYSGKKVFDVLQSIKTSDLELFLKYVIARPKNYAGNKWKISEVFATWAVAGSPAVVEH